MEARRDGDRALLLALRAWAREKECVSGIGATGTWPSCPRAGSTGPTVAGVRPPRGSYGLARSATDGAAFAGIRPFDSASSSH